MTPGWRQTLVVQRLVSYFDDPDIQNDPRQRYLPPGSWDWEGAANWYDPDRQLRPTYEHRFRSIPDLHQAGVGILAGSDMDGGFPQHDELAIFVDAGLTPLEALRTATLNPAQYLEKTDSLGTIEEGKLADLVLLEANPLEDISNTQKIHAVVANGRYLDRQALDRLLSEVEQAANSQGE